MPISEDQLRKNFHEDYMYIKSSREATLKQMDFFLENQMSFTPDFENCILEQIRSLVRLNDAYFRLHGILTRNPHNEK